MFVVAALIFGLVAFERLAINLLPDITYPTVTVRTNYEGTAPSEMERLVTEPVEGSVGVVTNVIQVTSTSRPDVSDVVVEFGWGTDMDFASLDIREKLDRLQLPQGSEKPVLLRFDPSLDPIIRVGLYGQESLIALRLLAEEQIRPELEALEGVAAVRVNGGLEEEIHIEVDGPKLAALRIPLNQVVSRLEQENVNLTGGELQDGGGQRGVYFHDLVGSDCQKGAELLQHLRTAPCIIYERGIAGRQLATGKGSIQEITFETGALSHQIVGGVMIDGGVIDECLARAKRTAHFLENIPYRGNVLEIEDYDLGVTCCHR